MKHVMRVIYFLLFIPFLCGIESIASAPNVLLICVDDLRPELRCFGADYIQSPHIDRLASQGRVFRSHYVQAPTCGASRYTLLTGRYGGASNSALFQRAARLLDHSEDVPASMPAWFRSHGYTTVSVGKVSHHPGGLGGKDWNDSNEPEIDPTDPAEPPEILDISFSISLRPIPSILVGVSEKNLFIKF